MRRGLGVLLVGMLRLSVAEWDEREELRGHPGGMVQEEEAPGDEGETFWEGGWEGDVQEDGFSDGDLRNVLDWLSRSQQSQPFIVVQVGAHVGNDLMYNLAIEHQWGGVLVEPVPMLYTELVANYRRGGASAALRFENAAVGEHVDSSEEAPFYERQSADYARAGTSGLGGLRTQQGSLRHPPDADGTGWLVTAVKTVTFEQLLRRHNLTHIDYLHLSTEGLDAAILHQVPLAHVMPKVIRMQSRRLSAVEEQQALMLLRHHGYRVAAGVAPERHVTAVSAQLAQHMLRLVDTHSDAEADSGGVAAVAVDRADSGGAAAVAVDRADASNGAGAGANDV